MNVAYIFFALFSYVNLFLSILFVYLFFKKRKMNLFLHFLMYYLIFSNLFLSVLSLTNSVQ